MKKKPYNLILEFGMVMMLFLLSGLLVQASDPVRIQSVPFHIDNMFPGDSVSETYQIDVEHSKPIILFYHADIRPGYEKLAEVLKVTIHLPDKNQTLYTGLMRDMPAAVEYRLAADEKTVLYEITAWLDTSVGNDYQKQELIADFRWWYAEEEPDPVPPIKPGEDGENGDGGENGGGGNVGIGGGSGNNGSADTGTINSGNGIDSVSGNTVNDSVSGSTASDSIVGGDAQTGDDSPIEFYLILFLASMGMLILLFFWPKCRKRSNAEAAESTEKDTDTEQDAAEEIEKSEEAEQKELSRLSRKYRRIIGILLILLICMILGIGAYALSFTVVRVNDNYFQTGEIDIDLNGGQAVISPDEYLFEPGMTVEKPFYIKNNGTWAVYYKLYFTQVSGELADVLEVSILDENGQELRKGEMSGWTALTAIGSEQILDVGQQHDLTMRFYYPKEAGNVTQDTTLSFALSATAVQTKNNPDRRFE